MYCADVDECFRQIGAYFNGCATGYPMVLDTENIGIYSEILQRLEADKSKTCYYVSESCQKNGLPDIDACIFNISKDGDYVLIGISQALMLRSERDLEKYVDMILGQSISGHALVILGYCKQYIEKFESRDYHRISRRTILIEGLVTPLPKIVLVKHEISGQPFVLKGIKRLLAYLEKMNETQINREDEILVKTDFGKNFFSEALYQITEVNSAYESLIKQYSDIAGFTEKDYGTEEQWEWLAENMRGKKSFSELVYEEFGILTNLEYVLQEVEEQKNPVCHWLFWLALKANGTKNKYLQEVLLKSENECVLEEMIYMYLADIDIKDEFFENFYAERKKLLRYIPDDLTLIAKYCGKVGKYEKNAVYYLTDGSENEEIEFLRYLNIYEYSEDELYTAVKHFSPMLELYMRRFAFDSVNTKVAEADRDLCNILSKYFQEYKAQKITNKIYPYFIERVNQFAVERPYNKLRPRSSIVAHLDKANAELFFFDALGVEYLSFIKAKCEEYGLIIEISVGHCELPSITERNKEFIQYFENNYRKIDKLDDLKHHSQIYDYQKTKEPVHIFRELEIIDEELRRIQSLLVQSSIEKAIIVSDHGASRLAVISELENVSKLELDEKGQHSGRCCPIEYNPDIPYAAYEDGFSVLANYERFRGGRKANVEVHGGATLEEVVVPVIVLSRKPENIEYCFTDPVIRLKQKEIASLTLYCTIPMNRPRILVEHKFYEGEFVADQRHAKFIMPELKRSRDYTAEIYEGDKSLSIILPFKIQKTMGQEVDLFA